MQARLVMCAMEGTTVFDRGDMARILSQLFKDRGMDMSAGRWGPLIGLALPQMITQAVKRSGDPRGDNPQECEAITADAEQRLSDHFSHKATEIPGTLRALDLIKQNGAFIALQTGLTRPVADAILDRLHWKGGIIDTVITASEVNRPKPSPDSVLQIMRSLGVDNPLHIANIGGTPQDLIMGSTGGCGWNIGVLEGNFTREALGVYPHTHLVPNISHVPEILID